MKPADSAAPETAHVVRSGFDEPMHPVQLAGFRKMSVAQKFDIPVQDASRLEAECRST